MQCLQVSLPALDHCSLKCCLFVGSKRNGCKLIASLHDSDSVQQVLCCTCCNGSSHLWSFVSTMLISFISGFICLSHSGASVTSLIVFCNLSNYQTVIVPWSKVMVDGQTCLAHCLVETTLKMASFGFGIKVCESSSPTVIV